VKPYKPDWLIQANKPSQQKPTNINKSCWTIKANKFHHTADLNTELNSKARQLPPRVLHNRQKSITSLENLGEIRNKQHLNSQTGLMRGTTGSIQTKINADLTDTINA